MNPTQETDAASLQSFDRLAALTYRESGLKLVPEKMAMVLSRLRSRMRETQSGSFESYVDFVHSDRGAIERKLMISALTTNVSHFFREPHHFDILGQHLKDCIKSPNSQNEQKIRIWSAGCSNGQEAYTIAINIAENFPQLLPNDIRILATDIDPQVVAFGKKGRYHRRQISGVPENLIEKYFQQDETDEDCFIVDSTLRDIVVFKELNLLRDWPIKSNFQAIFCRNVVIYFDQETQEALWPRFRNVLGKDGLLFLGHSERMSNHESLQFVSVGPTAYQISGEYKSPNRVGV